MRTREEILKALLNIPGPDRGESLAFEVLIDIRDELVRQGKPEIAASPVHLEPSIAGTVTACDDQTGRPVTLTWDVSKITCMACLKALLLNGSLAHGPCLKREEDLRAQIRQQDHGFVRVGKLVGVDTSTVFVTEEVVERVRAALIDAEAFTALRTFLASYLGAAPSVVALSDAVRDLGSLAQDRKDEIERLQAALNDARPRP